MTFHPVLQEAFVLYAVDNRQPVDGGVGDAEVFLHAARISADETRPRGKLLEGVHTVEEEPVFGAYGCPHCYKRPALTFDPCIYPLFLRPADIVGGNHPP